MSYQYLFQGVFSLTLSKLLFPGFIPFKDNFCVFKIAQNTATEFL